ncbi:MerC family mercury resistance protein [Galbibacter sp. PAP.153]|uniref:MerC family mercury resistance protein n=1 Tax=Galbibacter sp. PAP.153 TaxID=3104623 RepID=UPI003009A137
MKQIKSKLGTVASLLALITCYGTIGSIALLSFIGISVQIDEKLMITIVTILLAIALLGMLYSFRLHKNIVPLLLALIAIAILVWVFYGAYSKALELSGFALLLVASVLDFRSKKKACPIVKKSKKDTLG